MPSKPGWTTGIITPALRIRSIRGRWLKRLRRLPIGLVEILLWAVVLLAGWLLGGPVGIGTIISTFGAGLVMQLVYTALRFEPRRIRQRSVAEVARLLAGREAPGAGD